MPIEGVGGYYDASILMYRIGWNLDSGLALHFGFWDESTDTLDEALQRENEVLAERAEIAAGSRVLDAGCGVGGSSIFLARTFGCEVTGVTLSPKQAALARQNAARAGVSRLTDFRVLDYLASGLPSASFDVVWAIESFCHAEDKRRFADEAFRMLAPGGRLVIADGFAARERYEGRDHAVMRRWLDGWCVEELETLERVEGHLRAAGFARVESEDATARVLRSSRLIRRRAIGALPLAVLLGKRAFGHVFAGYRQYDALVAGLWRYAVVLGKKSPLP